MIVWAFQSGFHVYISDGTQMDRPLTEIRNMDDFYQQWEIFAGVQIGMSIHIGLLLLVIIS
ncbi:hypothetical protein AYY17_05410 [Morganella psychrotolerans]|uniref:Uncharacterized protein n=1 Tax=Morganella psychrotolerans TaxID=368603 RepID=A0A1B8HEF9_9GAMM|nr:hypothetical protein AYY17_05410 [Morganella psychrotolerans]